MDMYCELIYCECLYMICCCFLCAKICDDRQDQAHTIAVNRTTSPLTSIQPIGIQMTGAGK